MCDLSFDVISGNAIRLSMKKHYNMLLKIVTKCLVTRADTARNSKPIKVCSHEPISALT